MKVTLRKDRMYEFLDRLVNIALPRVTSEAFLIRVLMDVETMLSVCVSRLFSLKSIMTKLIRCVVWIFVS